MFPAGLDHLVYAAPDLPGSVARFAEKCGVEPAPGGSHPGFGTRNFLLALGPRCYLELIGPDPEQPDFAGTRPFGLDTVDGPRLVTWALAADRLDARLAEAKALGYDGGRVFSMNRRRADGATLTWELGAQPGLPLALGGVVPFLIDWGGGPHPADTAPAGCRLRSLSAEHPDPTAVSAALHALGAELTVTADPRPALHAVLETPRGEVRLA